VHLSVLTSVQPSQSVSCVCSEPSDGAAASCFSSVMRCDQPDALTGWLHPFPLWLVGWLVALSSLPVSVCVRVCLSVCLWDFACIALPPFHMVFSCLLGHGWRLLNHDGWMEGGMDGGMDGWME